MTISRNSTIASVVLDTNHIVKTEQEQTEIIDLGSSAISGFTLLGRLSTTNAVALYEEDLTNQVFYGAMISYNEVTNECVLIKAGLIKSATWNIINSSEAEALLSTLTAAKQFALNQEMLKLNIRTI